MKSLLIDTHVFLWLATEPERVPGAILEQLADPARPVLLSAVSAWEIAIKYRLGKLALPEPPDRFVARRLERHRLRALPVEVKHAVLVAELPDHHTDPFDRLLVAQAQWEGLTLVSGDAKLGLYEVDVWWAD